MLSKIQKIIAFLVVFISLFSVSFVQAQTQTEDFEYSEPEVSILKAKVVEVVREINTGFLYDGGQDIYIQEIKAEILDGENSGQIISIGEDWLLMDEGDKFYVEQYEYENEIQYTVLDYSRTSGLKWLLLAFIILIIIFGKWQGVRSIVSLGASLLVIIYILIPLLLNGAPPILTSVALGTLILAVAIFFTHGFNKRSLIAFGGTTATVLITGVIAALVVNGTHLTGFGAHESTYLDFNTGGQLDFVGLLLAGIIVGILGVLDDIAITQVAVVRELYALNEKLGKKEVFTRALRVGKEHVAALVNTLVLAYVGVSLPLLLYVSTLDGTNFALLVSSEVFATEIVRIILGSAGLIFAVPLTTFAAALFLGKTRGVPLSEKEQNEGCCGHAH